MKPYLGVKAAEEQLETFQEENSETLGVIGDAVQDVLANPEVQASLESFKNQLANMIQQ